MPSLSCTHPRKLSSQVAAERTQLRCHLPTPHTRHRCMKLSCMRVIGLSKTKGSVHRIYNFNRQSSTVEDNQVRSQSKGLCSLTGRGRQRYSIIALCRTRGPPGYGPILLATRIATNNCLTCIGRRNSKTRPLTVTLKIIINQVLIINSF